MANPQSENKTGTTSFRPEIARPTPPFSAGQRPGGIGAGPGAPGAAPAQAGSAAGEAPRDNSDKARLIVGREIVLKGEITACEQLIVEGRVECSLKGGRLVEISETGSFNGSVEVQDAIISGRFDGHLTVRGTLTLRSTGRIEGEVRYGTIQIEPGGVIRGSIDTLNGDAKAVKKDGPAASAVASPAPTGPAAVGSAG